jgi:hypothetical protein
MDEEFGSRPTTRLRDVRLLDETPDWHYHLYGSLSCRFPADADGGID